MKKLEEKNENNSKQNQNANNEIILIINYYRIKNNLSGNKISKA